MRKIETHKCGPSPVIVEVSDDADANGDHHHYTIYQSANGISQKSCDIRFQKGPVSEIVNGISIESLLAVAIDRLGCLQKGKLSCRDNAVALTHLETALLWLHKRTMDRERRGVEGTTNP